VHSPCSEIARRVIECTLPKAEWTHEAHLRVGLWHVLQLGPDQALTQLRRRISAYNVSVGTANTDTSGYHETITRFYVRVIAQFVASVDATRPVDDLADEFLSRFGDRKLALRFFDEDRLMTPLARGSWIEPDRPVRL
jgi:hypothetical protein